MPSLPPRICACGKAVPAGIRCECRQRSDRERKARHDERRPSASQRGYGPKWKDMRAKFLAAHPVCTKCGEPSKVVDHVIPHKMNMKLLFDWKNLQALCKHCHDSWKQSIDRQSY